MIQPNTPDFDTLYQGLNEAQRQAVDAIEGPVMVIAGPGTGKTQILAVRILNILKSTDTRPDEILCLTYTDAGSAAMRQRLSKFMGADAYKVNIFTFHALCNKIIQENPEKFSHRELRVMDDLDQLELLDTLIRNLPADSPIKNYSEDPGALRKQISSIFRLMQEEDIGTAFLQENVSRLADEDYFMEVFPELVYTRGGKYGKAGELKRREYDELHSTWKKMLAAAELFEEYARLKNDAGVYEFSDMLHWVKKAFDEDPDLLAEYQEKYQYILVDEYQDTSGIQNHILYQLISYWENNPNCFVVGDDDQSIYAFQGARPGNMKEFYHKYAQNLTNVVLTENYRSTQRILDASGKLIAENKNRLVNEIPGLSKELTAAGNNRQFTPVEVTFSPYVNRFHEAAGICEQVRELIDNQCPPEEIAVIYSKHAIAAELIDILISEHVPFNLTRTVDILKEPLIKKLCLWLDYLSLELEVAHKGEPLLYELLHFPLYNISPFEIATVSTEIYKRKSENLRWRTYLAELATKPVQPGLFGNGKLESLIKLHRDIEGWLKEASKLTVPQLVEELIGKFGFLSMAMNSQEKEWQMEQLHTFLSFAQNWYEKNPFESLGLFTENIERMQRNGIATRLEKRIGSGKGIALTTAHSSKGLEYKHVFIIGAEQDSWEKDRSGTLPFKLKPLFQAINKKLQNAADDDNTEERRRLFFVAMTRAKQTLHISWGSRKVDAKAGEQVPTSFITQITGPAEFDLVELPENLAYNAGVKMLQAKALPAVQVQDMIWLKKQLENFKFSPSTLYDILDCGLKFYFSRIIRVPSSPGAAAGYGLAVHGTLNRAVQTGTAKDGTWPDEETLIRWFEFELYKERRSFTKNSYALKLSQGREQLPAYYRSRLEEWKKDNIVLLEKWFETSINGAVVGGKIDKLVFHGNDVIVVDYKTGNAKNAEKSFKAPSEKSLLAGKLPPKYWFQLGIYMIVCSQIPGKDWKPVMAQIDLLDSDDEGNFPVLKQTYTEEQTNMLLDYIDEANRRLQNFEFLNGCGKPDCSWCQFAKETGQVRLPKEDAEEVSE